MNTEHVIYSHGRQYKPFFVSFEQLKIENRKINSILILGLGLGSVPILLNECGVKCKTVCVELDKSVITLCEKYLNDTIFRNLEIVCADAGDYVSDCKNNFDLIIIDIFIDNMIPKKFQTGSYLEQLNNLLSPGRMLMYNRLMTTDGLKKESVGFFENVFNRKFANSFFIPTKSNLVLIAEKK